MSEAVDPVERLLEERSTAGPALAEETRRAVLVFELGGEAMAVEGALVEAVLPMTEPFFVPGCPPSLEGVILHRGEVESLIDISGLLGRPSPPRAGSRAILLARTAPLRSGVRVDRVLDVLELPESALAPAPPSIREALGGFAERIVETERGPLPLLDLAALLGAWKASLG